ncbi:Uncharacterised protein [Mycobacteroides abscessus subsp. abscessus]|nr:Uncharacterised protein [Mycobacteroides abscessus subsp. abscessus]
MSAPSAIAVATSSAAQRAANQRSARSAASWALRITESSGMPVPLTLLRCS